MIITETNSFLMEYMATHETYYITDNPNVKNRSTEFNE
jgi:Tfp pilus assembly protein PilE